MGFFENTRKPQGFGGKIMVKMMNIGHSKLAKWGFTKIYAKSNAKVLDRLWRWGKHCQLVRKMFNRACYRDRLFKSQRRGIEKTKRYRNQSR